MNHRFLIAALHVAALEECDTIAEIKEATESLPMDLDVLYARTVERISRSKPKRARIGLMALLWVVHAKRPLQIEELQQLLATECAGGSSVVGTFNAERIPEKNVILASTCGLLTVDSSNVIRLMREYYSLV